MKNRTHGRGRGGYVLLETVIATGMLIVGLAVIGAQLQSSDRSLRTMDVRLRAMMLAEEQLGRLSLGLVKLDSLERVQDGDFGPRYPDFGWTLELEESAIDGMYALRLDVWHARREEPYQADSFEFEAADPIFSAYALRAVPQPLDLGIDYGLNEEELAEVEEKLSQFGVAGLDVAAFDPTILGQLDFEQFIQVFPILVDVMGLNVNDLSVLLPPDILRVLQESGVFGEPGEGESGGEGGEGGNP